MKKLNILQEVKYKCSVSSVLNRDNKQHGKSFLFDGCEDTAWSSDQGALQWIVILLEEETTINSFAFQFQGGFAGKNCLVKLEDKSGQSIHEEHFYPDDINAKQTFGLSSTVENVRKMKFSFEGSTDFFGRIIVYNLELHRLENYTVFFMKPKGKKTKSLDPPMSTSFIRGDHIWNMNISYGC